MSALRFVLVVAALALPALAPALVAFGRRPLTLLLTLPAGGLLAAAAAELAVATATALTPWLVAVDVAANIAAALVVWRRRRAGRSWVGSHVDRLQVLAPALAVVAVGLSGLSRYALDWDSRSIWLTHARLLRAGGGHYVDALHNSAYTFSHVDYPPYAAATVAAAWKVWGASSYRVAQVVLALQGAALLVAVAAVVGGRLADTGRRWLVPVLTAALLVASLGPIGLYLTDGYADVIVAAGATVAAVALLVEPPTPDATCLGMFGALVAATTKDEGLVAALLVVALWSVRRVRERQSLRRVAPAGVAVVAAMLAWPAIVAARGGPHGSILSSGTVAASTTGHGVRLAHTVSALAGHMLVLPIVLVSTLLVVAAVRRDRLRMLVRPLSWLWALVVLDVVVLLATYTLGKLPIHYWLRTSADRVSIFPVLLLDVIAVLTVAGVVADTGVATPRADADDAAGKVEMLR